MKSQKFARKNEDVGPADGALHAGEDSISSFI